MKSLLALLAMFVTAGCAPRPGSAPSPAASPVLAAQAQLIDVGVHKLWIECAGTENPTVILEGGLGVYSGTWFRVMPQVAAFARVCRFDGGGLGLSEPGPRPRTSEQMTQELQALLASAYPDEVDGLVLVDAIHPDLDERIEKLLTPSQARERRDELELNQQGIKFADILTSEDQVRAAGPVPDVPLIVIRHGLPHPIGRAPRSSSSGPSCRLILPR